MAASDRPPIGGVLRLPAGAKPTARQMELADRVYIGGRLVKNRYGDVPTGKQNGKPS